MNFSFNRTLLFFSVFSITVLQAQDTIKYNMSDIVVTSSKSPVSFNDLSRSVNVISAEEIKSAPANNITDLLQYSAGVDLRQRGTEGMQADVSIRGGSFEQVLILIDGVPFNDPQTGHYNLNLPLSLLDVERIEILKGQGSKVFGAGAFSGAINIIPKKRRENSVTALISGGENAFHEMYLGGSYNLNNLSFQISGSRKKSDGFQPNTDFKLENYSGSLVYSCKFGTADFFFGYVDKTFGANGFYAGNAECERIITRFAKLSANLGNDNFYVSPKFYFRQNTDDYVYLRTNPDAYRNNHTSFNYGADIQVTYKTDKAAFTIGGGISIDSLEGNRLGNHQREQTGFFSEIMFSPLSNLNINIGSYLNKYSNIGWKFWPGIDVSYNFSKTDKIFASAGKAYRLPSYTELYYKSASSVGNTNLKYEEVINYETGFTHSNEDIKLSAVFFHKKGLNNIDWIDKSENNIYYAENFAEVITKGIELSLNLHPATLRFLSGGININLNYAYIQSDKNTDGKRSRDYLEAMRHQFIAEVKKKFEFGLSTNLSFRYEDRLKLNDIFLVDGNILYKVKHLEIFTKVTNIFDRKYKKHLFAELPGRWIIAGIKFNISED
ncbi:MAG: TonB-dependent receptor [Ignavibacteria bacterium]|nr:TonB-dependent receptor [Ignavibacteria bacterium]